MSEQIIYPKVLIGCITAEAKEYCQDDFFEQLRQITYPNKNILFVDNSATDNNYKKIVKAGFNCVWIKRGNKPLGVLMAESHDTLRQQALNNNYEYLFHFETDIFLCGNFNIIELLLHHRKKLVAACYDTSTGSTRTPCVLLEDSLGGHVNPYLLSKLDVSFFDGTIKKVWSAGIGAVLIHRSVLEKIKFWANPKDDMKPDMHFAQDVRRIGVDFLADTSLYLEHRNLEWGVKGIDYK